MGPNLLPQMPRLRFLNVSENNLVNVQQGALMGLRNLTYLSLSHNQVSQKARGLPYPFKTMAKGS